MDYGGNPSYIDSNGNEVSCGYAPIVVIYADHADWPAPGWYGGEVTVDPTMNSPLMCQARCIDNADCDYFSYEWELTSGEMYHECYLKEAYTDANTDANVDAASCMADPYVPWSSEDAQWHGESGEGVPCAPPQQNSCGGRIGEDYGGNPSYTDSNGDSVSCGYAPIVVIYADSADWQAPGWYGGELTIDATMWSAFECQDRCFNNADCDFYSYEWEWTAGAMYHECCKRILYRFAHTRVVANQKHPSRRPEDGVHRRKHRRQRRRRQLHGRPVRPVALRRSAVARAVRPGYRLHAAGPERMPRSAGHGLRRQSLLHRLERRFGLVRLCSHRRDLRRPRRLERPRLVRRPARRRRVDGQPARVPSALLLQRGMRILLLYVACA